MHSASHISIVFMLVGLIVGIFIVIAASRVQAKKRRERGKMLQMVAVQLGGTVIPGSYFKQPNLAFEHLGHPARLEFYSTGGKNPHLLHPPDIQLLIQSALRASYLPGAPVFQVGQAAWRTGHPNRRRDLRRQVHDQGFVAREGEIDVG